MTLLVIFLLFGLATAQFEGATDFFDTSGGKRYPKRTCTIAVV